jgi:hypothetical protein
MKGHVHVTKAEFQKFYYRTFPDVVQAHRLYCCTAPGYFSVPGLAEDGFFGFGLFRNKPNSKNHPKMGFMGFSPTDRHVGRI